MDITKTSGEIHALLFKAKELVEELQGNIDSIQEDYGVDGNDDGPIGEATGEALEIVNALINVDEDWRMQSRKLSTRSLPTRRRSTICSTGAYHSSK